MVGFRALEDSGFYTSGSRFQGWVKKGPEQPEKGFGVCYTYHSYNKEPPTIVLVIIQAAVLPNSDVRPRFPDHALGSNGAFLRHRDACRAQV